MEVEILSDNDDIIVTVDGVIHTIENGILTIKNISAGSHTIEAVKYEDDEFNYILRTLMYSNLLNQAGLTGGKTITARRTSFILKQGAFHLKQIVEVPQNPFGKYINVHIVFKLSVRDGKEKIEILSAKAGVFDIPKQMLEKKLKKAVDTYYRGTSRERIVQESVIELHTDEKGIFMEYRPYVFRKNLKKNSGGPAGIFLGNRGVRFER